MTLIRTVPPGAEPVTLAEAKAHLRVGQASEDGLIQGLIRAARDDVERATGLALIEQGWRLVLDEWPDDRLVTLKRHPLRQVDSVTVYDDAGEPSVLSPSAYRVDASSRPARLLVREPVAVGSALNGIEIDFTAGFGAAATDVPDLLKRAMLLLVAHWFEFRGAFGAGDQPVSYPAGYERLLDPFRQRRLCA